HIQAIEDPAERAAYVAERRTEYEADVDLLRLAAELVVEAVVQPEDLRRELVTRLGLAATRVREERGKRHGVPPV
ncbi:MAG: acyl-CoA carboxylase subunit beta, partial [Actinomycetota bacterium]